MKHPMFTSLSVSNKSLFVFLFLSFGFLQCKKENCVKECPWGRYFIDGACQCPPGSFEYEGICKAKNQFVYFLDSTNCSCLNEKSSFEFFIDWRDMLNNSLNQTGNEYKLGMSTNKSFQGAYGIYNKLNQTFYLENFINEYMIITKDKHGCDYNRAFIFGYLSNGNRNLKMNIYWHNERLNQEGNKANVKDSCTMWLRNGMARD